MKNISFSTILGLTFGILLAGYMAFWTFNQNEIFPAEVKAGVTDNVSGFAWSENIGWLSFNCTNDHDSINGGVQTCIDVGGVDYGVNIRSDNYLEGYAWSENIGWVSFNLADTGAPPGDYDYSSQGFIAQFHTGTGELRGWARALAGMDDPSDGWDGWIKLYKHPSDVGPDYGVTYNSGTGEFSSFAWGSDVIGWLSFNCVDLVGVCGTSNYKVTAITNSSPSVSGLSVSQGDYCSVPSHSFSWTFSDSEDGSTQTSYEFQADNDSDFSSPEVSLSGGSSSSHTVIVAVSPGANQLAYNISYNWRVKVFDSQGADSGWIDGSAFLTQLHLYPDSNFTFNPSSPSQGEEISLSENTTCYDISNNVISCPTTAGNYSWDFDYETPLFTQDAIGKTATTTYNDADSHTVALDITDQDSNTCRGTQDISPQSSFPKFKETAPGS